MNAYQGIKPLLDKIGAGAVLGAISGTGLGATGGYAGGAGGWRDIWQGALLGATAGAITGGAIGYVDSLNILAKCVCWESPTDIGLTKYPTLSTISTGYPTPVGGTLGLGIKNLEVFLFQTLTPAVPYGLGAASGIEIYENAGALWQQLLERGISKDVSLSF